MLFCVCNTSVVWPIIFCYICEWNHFYLIYTFTFSFSLLSLTIFSFYSKLKTDLSSESDEPDHPTLLNCYYCPCELSLKFLFRSFLTVCLHGFFFFRVAKWPKIQNQCHCVLTRKRKKSHKVKEKDDINSLSFLSFAFWLKDTHRFNWWCDAYIYSAFNFGIKEEETTEEEDL